ncbi:MAG TPA: DNA translocase FtsK, partial [Pirellulales bacterium]|nr:DNA translocase FtsK [Pirellulales bacterium]
KVVDFVGTSEPQFVKELVQLKAADPAAGKGADLRSRDEFYEAAVDIVIREGRGSVSLLQRALGIGYGRAARLIDFMAEDGIVGAYNGSQAREVLITLDQWADMLGQEPEPAAKAPKRNRILPDLNQAAVPFDDDSGDAEADLEDFPPPRRRTAIQIAHHDDDTDDEEDADVESAENDADDDVDEESDEADSEVYDSAEDESNDEELSDGESEEDADAESTSDDESNEDEEPADGEGESDYDEAAERDEEVRRKSLGLKGQRSRSQGAAAKLRSPG